MKVERHASRALTWKRRLWLQRFFLMLCVFFALWALLSVLSPVLINALEIPNDSHVLRILTDAAVLRPVAGLLDGSAIAEVLGAIGLLSIVGPLLAITEQRVLGESIGTLVGWAYPQFFLFYFCCFIFTTLLGIYTATAKNNRAAIALTFTATLIGTGFILWVCCVFLIPGERRERLALTYYEDRMTLREKGIFPRLRRKEITQDTARDHLQRTRLLMLKLAGALARREAEGRPLWTENVRELWVRCAEQCEAAQRILNAAQPQEAAANYCCLLAKKFWELLSKQTGMPLSQLELLPALLFSRISSQPSMGTEDQAREKKELQAENYLAAGLLFTEAFHQAGEDQAWQAPYQLLCELYRGRNEWTDGGFLAFKKLFWGLAWIMVVHSMYETKADFCFLRELYYRGKMDQTSPAEEDELRSFLALLHKFYLQNTRFQDGISVGSAGPVYYEIRLLDFLLPYLDNPQEIGMVDPADDLAAVRRIVLKEGM